MIYNEGFVEEHERWSSETMKQYYEGPVCRKGAVALIVLHYCLVTGVTARKATITASMETEAAVEEEVWRWPKRAENIGGMRLAHF